MKTETRQGEQIIKEGAVNLPKGIEKLGHSFTVTLVIGVTATLDNQTLAIKLDGLNWDALSY